MSSVSKSASSVLPAPPASSTLRPEHLQFPSTEGTGRAPSRASLRFADLVNDTRDLRLSIRSDASALSSDTSLSLNTGYTGPLIPPNSDKSFRRRTLVLCFDGTGDQFDLDNSNVIQFFSVLKKGDRKRQLVYYQSGIGTYSIPQVATPLYSKLSKTLDVMFANHLNHHVMTGYHFLMQNYRDGDKICIFGFSRGAYTARALAGMVHKVGLLPAGNEQQIPFAYKMYNNDTELGWKQSVAFKRSFSIDVDIDFVGVWDTVASVGLLPTTLPFTKSNTAIKVFRHALSLDEHRAKFKPSIYQRITEEEAQRGDYTRPPTRQTSVVSRGRKKEKAKSKETVEIKEVKVPEEKNSIDRKKTEAVVDAEDGEKGSEVTTRVTHIKQSSTEHRRSGSSGSRSRALLDSVKRSARGVSNELQGVVERISLDRERSRDQNKEDDKVNLSPDSERDQLEQMYLDRSQRTDVQEVWFAGCHCDVGGGSVPNTTPNSLARIPLRWMIRECFLARTGIQFEADRLRDLGIDPATLYPRVMKAPHLESLDSPTSPASTDAPGPISPSITMKQPTSRAVAMKQNGQSTENAAGCAENGVSKGDSEKNGDAVTVRSAKSVNVCALGMARGRRRPNNSSLDATLVSYDGDSIDADAPDVHVEGASVLDEKISGTSSEGHEHDAVPNLATLDLNTEKSLKVTPSSAEEGSTRRQLDVTALEAQEEVRDARSDEFDQLKIAKWWWILEFIPMRERVQLKDGTWKKKWSMNRGRARSVPQEEPLMVHRSVKLRMEADLKYKPRLKFERQPIWVD